MKTLAAALIAVLVAGCAHDPKATAVPFEALPAAEQAAASKVELLIPSQLTGREVRVLGLVEGHACQSTFMSPPVNEQQALRQVQAAAARAGANGITELQCSRDISPRCSSAVSCYAKALQLRS